MIRKNRILLIIALHFLILNPQINSQSFLITKYSTDNGLPDNRVNDIAQDSLGRIWIAMASGIAMYDGYEWTKFGEKDGVPEVEYIKIRVDSDGFLWFLPKEITFNSIVYFDLLKFNSVRFVNPKKKSFNALSTFEVIKKEDNYELFIGSVKRGIAHFKENSWRIINVKDGLLSDSITCITKLKEEVYFSTIQGISVFTKDNNIIPLNIPRLNSQLPVVSMISNINPSTNKSNLILYGMNWLGSLSEDGFSILKSNLIIPYLGPNQNSIISVKNNEEIIFGNSAVLFIFNLRNSRMHRLNLDLPTSDRGGTAVLIDYEHNIWISSLRGIYKLYESPFQNYKLESGLLESEVSAVSEFNTNEIFLGHNYGFTCFSKNEIKSISILNNVKGNNKISRIMDVYHDIIADRIYFLSLQVGIGILSSSGSLVWMQLPDVSNYFSLVPTDNWGLIVNTDNGQYSITKSNFSNPRLPYVRKGIPLDSLTVLLTTDYGLIAWRINSQKVFKSDNEFGNKLYNVFYSNDYGILAASSNGVYKVINDSLIKFNFNDYNITDPVYFIIQDSSKNIWLGTNNGVLKWDGLNLKRYNKNDGLAGNETNRAAGFVDSKGNVWIGTDEGVSMYTGNEPDYSAFPPKIMLLDFKDHTNQSYNTHFSVKVEPDKNNLTFHYRGLSFLDEKRNSYQIKLTEVDGDYYNEFTTKSTSARFNNLAAGDYIFSVRVKNSKGIWSNWKNSAIISVQEHFYNEPFFYLGIFGLLLFSAYTLNNYFQQKKYTKRLEFAVDERTKNLKETQEQLITSLDRYKGIVESQTDLVIRFTKDGILTYVNDAYCVVFGKEPNQIIGKSFVPLIHPDDVEATFEEIKKLKDPPYRSTIEQRDFTIDGYRWFSWEGYAFRNQQEDIVEIQAVGRDITIQKEVEAELEKRVNERTIELQSLISQSPLGILTFDEKGYLLSYNKIANEMFCSLEMVLSNKELNLFEDELLLKNNYLEKLTNLDTPNSFLLTSVIKIENLQNKIYQSLQNHYIVYRIYNVMFDDKNKMYVLLVDDVTEQQQSEEISNKLIEEKIRISTIIKTIESERDRFSKELHDGLGQLLTTAKLKLDVIKMKSDQSVKEVNDTLNILINAGDEIRRIINDLKPADVESFGLVSSIELLVERIRQASGVNILLSVLTNIQIQNKETELIIYRIIQEALNNIVKHSKCNRAVIELLVLNDELQLKISDDGMGFDMSMQNQKFKSYGIQNIKERISSLNGKIEIESEPGKGFKYQIKIPL